MLSNYIQTYSGQTFNLLAPEPSQIRLTDIATALSHINRFTGHTNRPYSVAQHSLLVAAILRGEGVGEDVVFHGLMHDATEAYVGDVAKPLKELLPEYQEIEQRVWRAIAGKFSMQEELPQQVKQADLTALFAEAHELLATPPSFGWAGETSPFLKPPALSILREDSIAPDGWAELWLEAVLKCSIACVWRP
jgi:hypothetical protein